MTRWIGAVAFGDFRGATLKRAALLFDTLAATRVDANGRAATVDKLRGAGVVGAFIPLAATITISVVPKNPQDVIDVEDRIVDLNDGALAELLRYRYLDNFRDTYGVHAPTTADIRYSISLEVADRVQAKFPDDVVVPLLDRLREPANGTAASVLRVVLREMPMPDRSTPWEAIRDFRDDQDARLKLRRLRAFVSRMGREGVPPHEIADQIASMAADYQTYTRLQHAKIRHGFWQVLISTTAGVLEDIANFKFSGAAERLVNLRGENLRLRERELSAPGREVAYLAAVRARFESP